MFRACLLPSRPVLCLLGFWGLLVLAGCNFASQGLNAEGTQLYEQGDYQQAAGRFLQAIAQDPNNADSYYNLAATYHRQGKLNNNPADLIQAEDYYNKCLDHDANHTDCYRALAVLLTETDRSDAAVRLIEGWMAKSPHLANPKIEMARLMDEFGNKEAAKGYLQQAITVDPNNSRALTALGKLREESGDHVQALANYERSLALNRFQPTVASRVAALHAALGPAAPPASQANTQLANEPPRWTRY